MLGFLAFLLVAAAVAGLAWWQWRRAQQRREALFMFATARGWTFAVEDDSLVDHWVGTPFGVGDHRRVTNVMRGSVGDRTLTAFDYAYDTTSSTGKGEQRTTHRLAVVIVGMPAYLPTLEVTPESMLHRVGTAVGVLGDIELESEDFNRRFRVSAYDPRFASDVLHPRTMELLLARPPFAFRLQGTDAIGWAVGSSNAVEVLSRSSTLDTLLRNVPDYVWKDHGASA